MVFILVFSRISATWFCVAYLFLDSLVVTKLTVSRFKTGDNIVRQMLYLVCMVLF